MEPEVEVMYQKARLPDFDQIAQHASQEVDLEQFMEEVKAK